jgi:hypothetical protein
MTEAGAFGIESAPLLPAAPATKDTAPPERSAPAFPVGSATEIASSPGVVAVTAAAFESLAAAGFVSPGRPVSAPADSGAETVGSETVPSEEPPAESVGTSGDSAAIARYWRWMHARLDAHLEETEVEDLGAPPMDAFAPVAISWRGALEGVEPSRSVGLHDRAAFDGRAFQGLRDGFVQLG